MTRDAVTIGWRLRDRRPERLGACGRSVPPSSEPAATRRGHSDRDSAVPFRAARSVGSRGIYFTLQTRRLAAAAGPAPETGGGTEEVPKARPGGGPPPGPKGRVGRGRLTGHPVGGGLG
jgi:hypothetical protein